MNRKWLPLVLVGLGLAVLVALASPLASSHPDGLERVAEDKGFHEQARDPGFRIIPDYTFPGIENETVATILSGVIGVAVVAALMFGVAYGMRALGKSKQSGQPAETPRQRSG